MNRNNISLADYHAILVLKQTGTFRSAAEALKLSPSALSRQVSALETRLGTRLFDRDTRNVALTASGAVLAGIAERMVNTAEDAQAEFDAHLSARRGHLTIAGLPSVTAALLPGILRRFAVAHPEIDLKIIDALSDSVIDVVESGRAEIGFTAGTGSARSRLAFQPVTEDAFLAIGAADGPLAEDRAYDWAELVEMPFIAMARGTSVRELLDSACLRLGRPLSPRFEVAHLATAGAFVAAGLGVTALPELALAVLPSDRLVRRDIRDFGIRRRIGLVRQPGRSLSPAATAFMEVLTRTAPRRTDHPATH